jgi:L-2-hydroxycarboxylate dehydrogenase (NAD+)
MTEITIPDEIVRGAFAEALRIPADTGSDFFADLRLCLRRSLISVLPGQLEAQAAAHTKKAGGLFFSKAEVEAFNEIARECGEQEWKIDSLKTYVI